MRSRSRIYIKERKKCCAKRPSGCEVLKKRNSEGVKSAYNEGRKGYTWNPNSAWSRGKSLTPNEEIFTENSRYSNELVKQRIVKDDILEYRCSKCGIESWQGESIVLDLDHINGDNTDNRLSNLRYLCPNCHSQTETYKGRNKNSGKQKVSDQELLAVYQKGLTIRQTLLELGLAAEGNTHDLGTSTLRWRNIYTNDLNLNNGIGDWTIVEGADELFLYNNLRNKVYKFALIEVDPDEATPKQV